MGSVRAIPRGTPSGDPGFFGDLWGGIKGAVGGLVTGGPLGAVGGAVKGFIGTPAATSPTATAPFLPPMITMGPMVQQNGRPPQIKEPGFVPFVERLVPGGETGMMDDPRYRAGKASQSGWHWNKSGYFLKSGEYVEAGTRQVRNRKMNPLNPSAVKSSMRRLGRAKTAAKDINRVTIRKKACTHK
jgi:hypothetical protein